MIILYAAQKAELPTEPIAVHNAYHIRTAPYSSKTTEIPTRINPSVQRPLIQNCDYVKRSHHCESDPKDLRVKLLRERHTGKAVKKKAHN